MEVVPSREGIVGCLEHVEDADVHIWFIFGWGSIMADHSLVQILLGGFFLWIRQSRFVEWLVCSLFLHQMRLWDFEGVAKDGGLRPLLNLFFECIVVAANVTCSPFGMEEECII